MKKATLKIYDRCGYVEDDSKKEEEILLPTDYVQTANEKSKGKNKNEEEPLMPILQTQIRK